MIGLAGAHTRDSARGLGLAGAAAWRRRRSANRLREGEAGVPSAPRPAGPVFQANRAIRARH